MLIKNIDMDYRISLLEKFLDRSDKIGYAAARNIRRMQEASMEYMKLREDLINKYGHPELDENGNETGRMEILTDSPEFNLFKQDIEEIASIEHNVQIFTLPFSYVEGKLTGSEILEIDWMLEDLDSPMDE